jgi:hypothetical protein
MTREQIWEERKREYGDTWTYPVGALPFVQNIAFLAWLITNPEDGCNPTTVEMHPDDYHRIDQGKEALLIVSGLIVRTNPLRQRGTCQVG